MNTQPAQSPRRVARRLWRAYTAEVAKAVRRRYTYAGPVLLVAAVIGASLVKSEWSSGGNGYLFLSTATPLALDLLGLLLLLAYCAGLVSHELGTGSARLVLVRPLLRHEFIAAKILLGMTYAVLLTASTCVAAWAAARVRGLDMNGVIYGGEVIYTAQEMVWAYVVAAVLGLVPQFAAVTYAVMVSSLTRNAGTAVGSAIGFWLAADLVKHPLQLSSFLFSSYLESPWAVFMDLSNGFSSSWTPMAYWCTATSAVAAFAFVMVTVLVFNRRNLQA